MKHLLNLRKRVVKYWCTVPIVHVLSRVKVTLATFMGLLLFLLNVTELLYQKTLSMLRIVSMLLVLKLRKQAAFLEGDFETTIVIY